MKKNNTADFSYHLTKFFTEYLPVQRNLSPNTIASYRDTFRLLLIFYDTEKNIKPNRLNLDMVDRKIWKTFCFGLKKSEIVVQVRAINV